MMTYTVPSKIAAAWTAVALCWVIVLFPALALAAPSVYASNGTTTTGTYGSFIMSAPTDGLVVCESRDATGVTHTVTVDGTPMTNVISNTAIAGTTRLWADYGVGTSTSLYEISLSGSASFFLSCASFQDVRDTSGVFNVSEQSVPASSGITITLNTDYDDSLVVAGLSRAPGGTSLSAGTNAVAINVPVVGAGLYQRDGGTGTAGTWTFNVNASGSTNIDALVIEIPALASTPTTTPTTTPSTITRDEYVFLWLVFVFFLSIPFWERVLRTNKERYV